MKTIRIFVSSPGDVAEERERARQVVEQLRHRYAGRLHLKALLWEDLPLQADMSFQQGIELVLSQDQGVDIAVFILWSRLGTPLGPLTRKTEDSPYRSGTEREFDLMVAARGQGGKDRPKILFYTRQDEVSFDERLRGKPTDEKDNLIAQKKLVEMFIQEVFRDNTSGANVRAYHTFDQPVTFSKRLRVHLQEMLDSLVSAREMDPVWDIARNGSPFRGLEAFEFEHSPVFFGREDEILEVRRALQKKAQEGCAFVLISGASGSGKSSLARAGVLPAVVEHEVDSTVSQWRPAICTPSELGGDLCGGLARLLCSEGVLPELRISEDYVAVLAEGFARDPKLTVDQSLRPALSRASQRKPGATRLVLLVDQLEELFTSKRLTDTDRERFFAVLEALARSGVVWVLATARSDFFQHCQSLPTLVRMKEGLGQVDLLPPAPDALRRLIEHPALLAGLSFEQRDGTSLADRILTHAAARAELLPLVSYVLRELFEQRTSEGMLSFAVYEQLGGVEGALARRAETVFGGLPNAAQKELSRALVALVSVSSHEGESVVRQVVPLDTFPPDTPVRTLVDRFVAERFLVTGSVVAGSGGGSVGTVAVAHESLLQAWSRARKWTEDNQEFLRVRARVVARMKEGSRITEGDPLLEAARLQLSKARAGFAPQQAAFIESCLRTADQTRQQRDRLRLAAVILPTVLAILALIGAWFGFKGKREAEHQRKGAEAKKQQALQTLSQSEFLQACRFIAEDKDNDAVAYLVDSLKANPTNDAAVTRLATVLTYRAWLLPSLDLQHAGPVHSAQFSPDGERIVTASDDRTARVWDALTGQPLTKPLQHAGLVYFAQFGPDGKRIVTASGYCPRLWDAQTGQALTEALQRTSLVYSAQFSPDGKWIVTASEWMARIWDALTGQPLTEFPQDTHNISGKRVSSAQFSPDSKWIVTALGDSTAQVWDAETGRRLTEALQHAGQVNSAQFDPKGKRVLTASSDGTARVWDAQEGLPLTEPLQHGCPVLSGQFSSDGKRVVTVTANAARVWVAHASLPLSEPLKHARLVSSAHFSPDGKCVVTASYDSTARVWDAQTGQPLTEPLQHAGSVFSAHFSPDGKRVVTASSDSTARVWDAQTGRPLTEPLQHAGSVRSAQFSPDGKRIVTASYDHTARVWDAQTGQPLTKPLQHADWVESAQFSPDDNRVVTGSADCTAQVWDAQTGRPLIAPLQHGRRVLAAQFSPDGKRIVTASSDNRVHFTARVWDAQTGQPLTEPFKHPYPISSAEFSPDGKQIVTTSGDRALVWDVAPPSAGYPAWLLQLGAAFCGEVLSAQGVLGYTNQVQALDQVRQTLSERPGTDDWLVLSRWLLADRSTRTISPFSKITVPQYIENRIHESTAKSLTEARRLAYGNTNLLQRIAQAQEKLEGTKPREPTN